MKKKLIVAGILVFFGIAAVCQAGQAPHGVGGFVLDRDIAQFKDYVIMETALPIRHMENIQEVEIKPIAGLKSGLIAFASCAAPGHIVRIKLKYADSSKKFFEKLLHRIKNKYGEPGEYRGDAFHIMVAWKWSFVDQDGNRISMILKHNSMDSEEKKGNAIKLTMTSLMEKDRQCYLTKMFDTREKLRQREWKVVNPGLSGWDLFVPR